MTSEHFAIALKHIQYNQQFYKDHDYSVDEIASNVYTLAPLPGVPCWPSDVKLLIEAAGWTWKPKRWDQY